MLKALRIVTILSILGLALYSVTGVAKAQNTTSPNYSAIDAYLQSELQALNIPGAALAIVHGDQVVHTKGFGIADPSGRLMTPDTPFVLASVSKSFTAMAVMQLVEAGKLNLDAPVQRYLPWFQVADPAASRSITARMLLNHTSGLPGQAGFLTLLSSDQSSNALEQHVRALSTVRLDRAPGSTFEYCNANYDILGLLVQVVSGQSYETYVQQHIFAPLQMVQSFTSRSDAGAYGLASGYQHLFGLPVARQWPDPRAMVPSGFLISSAQDLTHFVIAQLNGGQYQGQAVLSAQGMAAMHTGSVTMNAEETYAMGWADLTLKGTHILGHDGDSYNYHTAIYLLPETQWGLVLLMNGSNAMYYARMQQVPLTLTGMLIGLPVSATTITNPLLLMNEFYRNSLVFAFLLVVVILWTGIRLRRWFRNPASRPQGVQSVTYLVLPLAFFLWEAWLFLFSLPKAMGGLPLTTMFFFRPDLIGLAVVLVLIALGWGTYYEINAMKIVREKRNWLVDPSSPAVLTERS